MKCKNRGAEFSARVQGRGGRNRRHCSDECRRAWYTANRKIHIKICRCCGKEFPATRSRQLYCSRGCAQRDPAQSKYKGKKAICLGCGIEFITKRKGDKYCSRPCFDAHHRRKERICRYCGKTFHPKRPEAISYCSRICAFAAKGSNIKQRQMPPSSPDPPPSGGPVQDRGDYRHRRRAKRLGVPYEIIDPAAIFERDKWTCRLCGGKIDKELSWPHPQSATIDHIIPMALGGGHLKKNVQAAHLVCNTAKGARVKTVKIQRGLPLAL
jgi:hypothetical protein